MNIDRYINDGQDPKVVEKLLLKLQDMLAEDEAVLYAAVQKMPAVTLFPDSIAVTDRRVLFCRSTKLGLATDFDIFTWDQVADISFKEGLLASRVILVPTHGDPLEMPHIPKSQARKLYQWCNKARGRQRNPVRQAPEGADPVPSPNEPGDELTVKLTKLKSLFERQLITQDEYENKKNELLSQL